MRKLLAVFLLLTLLGGISGAVYGASQGKGLMLSVSDKDVSEWKWQAGTKNTDFRLIYSRDEARQFIRILPKGARGQVRKALADVNFNRQVAIVAYLGERPGGYDVEIAQINVNDRSLLVRVGMQSPGKRDAVTMIATYPFDIVTLDRKDVPEGDFEFIVFNQHGLAVSDKWMNLSRAASVVQRDQVHTVRTGESLWSISQRYNVTIADLLAMNPSVKSDTIWIGQKLRVPDESRRASVINPTTYVVRTGDSLWAIAKKYGITVEDLMRSNSLPDHNILIGQKLTITA